MTLEPYLNVQIPRVGRDVESPRWPTSDVYPVAGEAYRSSMVLLAKLIGLLVMMAAGLTLIVATGYVLGGYVGALITVVTAATILIVVFRSDKAVACRGQLARGPGWATPDRDVIDTRRLGIQQANAESFQNRSHLG
jgi:hypothetical protein